MEEKPMFLREIIRHATAPIMTPYRNDEVFTNDTSFYVKLEIIVLAPPGTHAT
jgi:hypothetical protein